MATTKSRYRTILSGYSSSGTRNADSSYESPYTTAFSVPHQSSEFDDLTTPMTPEDVKAKTPSSYKLDYNGLTDAVDNLKKSLNIISPTTNYATVNILSTYYNRFKVNIPNEPCGNMTAHVYFVRPDLNLLNPLGQGLIESLQDDPELVYIYQNNDNIIKQLVASNGGEDHDWMLYLSNKASSFTVADLELDDDTYGETYGGWKIKYGKTNVKSKTAGTFTVRYYDDKGLSVLRLHKLWVDYIHNVYHGKWNPKLENIRNKILDYATAVYYIVTGEDGETILFWTKYFGVFPTAVPMNQLGWNKGTQMNTLEESIDIQYAYSFKEDLKPWTLYEFNQNSHIDTNTTQYFHQPIFDPNLGHSGPSFVGVPYIELIRDYAEPGCRYQYKLRHRARQMPGNSVNEYRDVSRVTSTKSLISDSVEEAYNTQILNEIINTAKTDTSTETTTATS